MQSKLQELTEKLYNDGVNKAHIEAETIIKDVKKQAETIINDANKKADEIIVNANKKSEEIKKNADSEIKLTSKQAIGALKQEIVDLINTKNLEGTIKNSLDDVKFIQVILETLIKNWNPKSQNIDLAVLLPEKNKAEMDNYFKSKSAELLKKGLELHSSSSISSGFKIGPKDGSYLISFSDKDFENFFKSYLRPKTTELLYGEK